MEPLAIVGIACRFPGGANSRQAFWNRLLDGYDAVGPVPGDRWDIRRFYDPSGHKAGRAHTDQGAFLDQPIDRFDPLFFGMSPREAAALDPQQRLLLECSWEAFEDAGVPVEVLQAVRTGVFVGGFCLDNKLLQLSPLNRRLIDAHTPTSSTMAILANRVSYTFDLSGPSVTMDTACSSSLVAFHYAAQSIWRGEADAALAAGVNVMTRPEYSIAMSQGRFLSPAGRCFAFDARASGYVRGEGVGVVLLKPLAAALRDGDRVHALVVATGINQDGRTPGMAQPSGQAQEQLIRSIYDQAGISPEQIDYVEAHGTGTQAGDTTELAALQRVFAGRSRKVVVGSVKTNIGHLEAGAGIAGVIKTCLALANETIPPNLHFEQANPALGYRELDLEVPTASRPWPEGAHQPHASINSFGYGGSNAHAVLRRAPVTPAASAPAASAPLGDSEPTAPVPVFLSAHSQEALAARAVQLAEVALQHPLSDLVWTLGARRSHLEYRAAVVARDSRELRTGLREIADGGGLQARVRSTEIAWVYTGMGPQRPRMALQLLETEPVFADAARAVEQAFLALSGWSILDALRVPAESSRMHRTEVAQPANFLVQVGLTELLRSYGLEPDLVVGHSVGEVAAAWASGALSLPDAVAVSYHRSRLQQQVAGTGSMLAVGLDADACRARIGDPAIEIAAVNAPGSVTLAGPVPQLQALASDLEGEGTFARLLPVEVPYHSAVMDAIADELRTSLAHLAPSETRVPLFSTVTGERIGGREMDASYWWRNVRQPVRFADAIGNIVAQGADVVLEVGPHPVLRAAVRQAGAEDIPTLDRRRDDEQRTIRESLAHLHCLGASSDTARWTAGPRALVDLPAYPWQRIRCWRETEASRQQRLGNPGPVWFQDDLQLPSPTWEVEADAQMFPWLSDHLVEGRVVFPGAGYLQGMALAVQRLSDCSSARLDHVAFRQLLALDDQRIHRLQLRADPERRRIDVLSAVASDQPEWKPLTTASYLPQDMSDLRPSIELQAVQAECTREVPAATIYQRLSQAGLDYGPEFQTVEACWQQPDGQQALARLAARPGQADAIALLDPRLLDGAFQTMALMADESCAYVPQSIERVCWFAEVQERTWARVRRRPDTRADVIRADIELIAEDGQVAVVLEGVICRALAHRAMSAVPLAVRWQPRERAIAAHAPGHWLVLADEPAVADVMQPRWTVECASMTAELTPLLADGRFDGVLLAPPRIPAGDVATLAEQAAVLGRAAGALAARPDAPRLCLLLAADEPAHQALASLLGVIENEYPQVRTCALLVSSETSARTWVDALAEERERVLQWHGDQWQVRRLGERPAPGLLEVAPHDRPVALQLGSVGQPDSLSWSLAARRAPGPEEVEVRVRASALNFKDLLKVYGQLPDEVTLGTFFGDHLGMEVTGEVVAVGERVERARVGDLVVTPATGGAFRSFVTVPETYVIPVPHGLTLEGAPLMIGYLTALRGLVDIARLGPGERVLIHNATGGVGVAALQIARWRGAVIHATAGTEVKRAWLREQGVEFVYPSRDLTFAERIRRDTEGRGVDVVLSAMSGDASRESLALLAPYGRYIEIGKRDISDNAGLPMRAFQDNLLFASVDIDRMLRERVADIQDLLERIGQLFASGVFQPNPVRAFDASEVVDAFRVMGRGEHIGKLVLTFGDRTLSVQSSLRIRGDASYLVTGGTGGFGLQLGAWLLERGAGHVVLASRRGARAASHARLGDDPRVSFRALDVTDEGAVRSLVAELASGERPLRGIFHSAMVLDDGLLADLDEERYRRVLAPKAQGAWTLHQAASELDLFVCLSSISSLVGTRGQGSYVVANAWLDALAEHRRAQGLPALSVSFGALAETGVVHRHPDVGRLLAASGIRGLSTADALAALAGALAGDAAHVCVADVDWQKLSASLPRVERDPLFGTHVQQTGGGRNLAAELSAMEPAEREAEVVRRIVAQIAAVMRIPEHQVSEHAGLDRLGIDSLVAVELTSLLARSLEVEISTVDLLAGPTSVELARMVLARLITEEDELLARVDELSEAQLDALMAQLENER